MKNFKLKIFSLALCICLCLSVFSGCSLFVPKAENNDAVALKIGETTITKQELINSYYSFYQQNYYYFMYYDTETIMDTFYDSVIAREIILAEANEMLKDGALKFSQEDMDDIWNDVYDYIFSKIDEKEKSVLLLADSNEENLPKRLQEVDEDKETPYKYEAYVFEPIVKTDYSSVTSAPEVSIDEKIEALKTAIFTYNDAKDEEDRNMVDIDESEVETRQIAFEMYVADLMLSAKANKKDSTKESVLKAEVERIYENYYENALYEKYQEYIESTAIGTDDGEFENKLSDAKIVEKYKKLLNASTESNTLLDNYVSVITSTDNESLILYHYNGKYTYFTVQHILVSFDNETLGILEKTEGYDPEKDAMFREYYEQVRDLYDNEGDMKTSYRDEKGYTVKDNEGKNVEVSITEIRQNFEDELTIRSQKLEEELAESQMTNEEKALARTRLRTLLFNEFAWKYSGDTGSLTKDKLSGVLGFTVSSETDEHGSFVKDFANGARAMYEDYLQDKVNNGIGMQIEAVTSDYGVHLMMLTGVYEGGEVVSTAGKTDAEIVAELKKNYVSNLTEQTLYEYVYDLVKEELVGESGTYFTDFRNSLVKNYKDNDLIEYVIKMSYEELNNAIN